MDHNTIDDDRKPHQTSDEPTYNNPSKSNHSANLKSRAVKHFAYCCENVSNVMQPRHSGTNAHQVSINESGEKGACCNMVKEEFLES